MYLRTHSLLHLWAAIIRIIGGGGGVWSGIEFAIYNWVQILGYG